MTGGGAPVLRPASAGDAPFLARLYAGTRDDLASLPLPEAAREALIGQQFRIREQQYAAAHPDASSVVIELDGTPVGRLLTDRGPRGTHVVDVAVLPEHRGRGLGTAVLSTVLADADARDLPVTLDVAVDNPAQRLYARLGFRPADDGRRDGEPAVHRTLIRPSRGGAQPKTAS